jgi:5,10-methylene-tetrahydrofolate dehydrogenase/methenyl tetrahydrofolate cyclohydrolase
MEVVTVNCFLIQGCIELLQRSGVSISNKRAVVVGRSNIVGLPVALLLIKLDATVTMVHSKTPDPKSIISEADIIIAAAGQANMVLPNEFNLISSVG